MSNSQMFNIMAGHYYDQLSEDRPDFRLSGFDPVALQGSLNNPLQALRLLCVDAESEMSFKSEELSQITGCPSGWFESDRLVAKSDEVIRALGVMSLVFLSCLRNEAFKYGFQVDVAEKSLEAKNTLIEVLKVNECLNSH